MYTEYRILEVDEHGDIVCLNEATTALKAAKLAEKATPSPRCIITVEGQRDYGREGQGARKYRRTGLVLPAAGWTPNEEQLRFLTVDLEWYEAGEEPDFSPTGA